MASITKIAFKDEVGGSTMKKNGKKKKGQLEFEPPMEEYRWDWQIVDVPANFTSMTEV